MASPPPALKKLTNFTLIAPFVISEKIPFIFSPPFFWIAFFLLYFIPPFFLLPWLILIRFYDERTQSSNGKRKALARTPKIHSQYFYSKAKNNHPACFNGFMMNTKEGIFFFSVIFRFLPLFTFHVIL